MSKSNEVFLQHGYQPKDNREKPLPPKRGSNIISPKDNDLEDFIKLCIDKFGTDKAIICFDNHNWGVQPIKTDETGRITDIQDGIAYHRTSKHLWED